MHPISVQKNCMQDAECGARALLISDDHGRRSPELDGKATDHFKELYESDPGGPLGSYRDAWLNTNPLKFPGRIQLACIIILSLVPRVFAATDLTKCMADIQGGLWGSDGVTDGFGNPVANTSEATGITYKLCVRACGSGPEAFQWTTFSERFNSWLLPWLAMIPMLHFCRHPQINLLSIFLTVGSPTLAIYSLSLAVLGGHWLVRKFDGITHAEVTHAIHVLKCLQQSPLKIGNPRGLPASLRNNKLWWRELSGKLNYTNTWSLATLISIVWVVVAYTLTVIGSFSAFTEASTRIEVVARVGLIGQGISSAWLWLLPVVVGWLRFSPKCDTDRVQDAIEHANRTLYIPRQAVDTPIRSVVSSDMAAGKNTEICVGNGSTSTTSILMQNLSPDTPRVQVTMANEHAPLLPDDHDSVFDIEECRPPIFYYARFLSWVQAVEQVCGAFQSTMGNAQHVDRPAVDARWRFDALSRIFVASLIALFLQWSTAVAAMLFALYTPTRGFGCRSGSYLIYASASTLVWILLLLSSLLAHYSTWNRGDSPKHAARVLSVALEGFGYVLAFFNFCWIIVVCLLQCGNFFSRCFCSSSYFGLRSRAFAELVFTAYDISTMKTAWTGAAALAGGTVVGFFIFLFIFIDPPPPSRM